MSREIILEKDTIIFVKRRYFQTQKIQSKNFITSFTSIEYNHI